MSYKVIIHPQAAGEADQAYEYIARRAPHAAVNWYNDLLDAIYSLADFPRRFALAAESSYFQDEICPLVFGNYRVLHTVPDSDKSVLILHVRHGAMRRSGESAALDDIEPHG